MRIICKCFFEKYFGPSRILNKKFILSKRNLKFSKLLSWYIMDFLQGILYKENVNTPLSNSSIQS